MAAEKHPELDDLLREHRPGNPGVIDARWLGVFATLEQGSRSGPRSGQDLGDELKSNYEAAYR